jgi:putative transposase
MPRKSQFTDEQIIRALKEVDAGAKPADVCRRLGVTEKTYYRWKQKFGGMEVNEAKRLRALEDENAKLKKLLADQLLQTEALRAVIAKKMVSLTAKRRVVRYLMQAFGQGERWACRAVGVARASHRYTSQRVDPPELVAALLKLAKDKPRLGYQFLTRHLVRSGFKVNKKRVYRLYREHGLALRVSSSAQAVRRVATGRCAAGDRAGAAVVDGLRERPR